MGTDEAAYAGDILVGIAKHVGGDVVGGIHFHGPKLVDAEKAFVLSHTLLGKENWPGIFHNNTKRNGKKHRRKEDEPKEGKKQVEGSLDETGVESFVENGRASRFKVATGAIGIGRIVRGFNKDNSLTFDRVTVGGGVCVDGGRTENDGQEEKEKGKGREPPKYGKENGHETIPAEDGADE